MRRLAVLGAAAVMIAGCAVHNLDFRVDTRVKITTPGQDSTVSLPLTIAWTAHDLPAIGTSSAGQATTYALFVDRQPMSPGATMRSIADVTCKHTVGCPDQTWMREHYIFTTTSTQFVLTNVPANSRGERSGPENGHEVAIVLLDGAGHRVGEGAFAVDFFVRGTA